MSLPFDLGYEVVLVPALWAVLAITSVTLFVKRKWKILGITAIGGALILASLIVVPPGHKGAIYSAAGGVSTNERPEGFGFIVPFFQNANMVNVREQKYEVEVYAQTKDILEVTAHVAINYTVIGSEAADIFKEVGQNYEENIVAPAVLDVTTREVGQIDALDFPQNRFVLTNDIRRSLNDRLEPRGIAVTYVAMQDSIFAEEFVAAVLSKETADEKASESFRLVQVSRNEAQQVIEKAKGEAEAITEVQQSLGFTNQQYLSWLQLQKWDGVMPKTLVSDTGNITEVLPVE